MLDMATAEAGVSVSLRATTRETSHGAKFLKHPHRPKSILCSPQKVSTRQFERDLDQLQASFAKAVKTKLEKFLHNRRAECNLQSVRQQYRYKRVDRQKERPNQQVASPPVPSERGQVTLPVLTVINFGRRYDQYNNQLLQKAALRRKLNSSLDTQISCWKTAPGEYGMFRYLNRSDMGVYPMLVNEGNQTGDAHADHPSG